MDPYSLLHKSGLDIYIGKIEGRSFVEILNLTDLVTLRMAACMLSALAPLFTSSPIPFSCIRVITSIWSMNTGIPTIGTCV